MAAVSLKQQKQGELIASETIEGVAKAIAENFHPEGGKGSASTFFIKYAGIQKR
jgi:hypothetical protein